MENSEHWPIFRESDQGKSFWNRTRLPPIHQIQFSCTLFRISIKRSKPKQYEFTLSDNGILYYKSNTIKGWLQLNENQSVRLVEIKLSEKDNETAKAFRLKRNQSVYAYLWNSSQDMTLYFFRTIAKHCFCQNFDQLYNIHDIIGKGGFSKVYLLSPIPQYTQEKFAGKVYTNTDPSLKKDLVRFNQFIKTESHLLRVINSEYVLKLENIIQLDEALILVTEYVKGGSLYTYLKQKKKLTEQEATAILLKVALGVQAIHKQGYVHRDIKLENILLDKTKDQLKIIDLGFAEQINREKLVNGQGTAGYMAPEIFERMPFTEISDVFSIGVIYYSLLTGKAVFKGKDYQDLLTANKAGLVDFQIEKFHGISPQTITLLKLMLAKHPSKRVSLDKVIETISQHNFLVPLTAQQSFQSFGFLDSPRNTQQNFKFTKPSLRSFYQVSQNSHSENISNISILQKRLNSLNYERFHSSNQLHFLHKGPLYENDNMETDIISDDEESSVNLLFLNKNVKISQQLNVQKFKY